MTKRQVSLYLESSYIEECKRKHINISEEVNDFLQRLLGSESKPNLERQVLDLENEKIRIEQELMRINKRKDDRITKMSIMNDPLFKEITKILLLDPSKVKGNINRIKNKLGVELTEEELLDMVNGRF